MSGNTRLYQKLSRLVGAYDECNYRMSTMGAETDPAMREQALYWLNKHEDDIRKLGNRYLPSGSGLDAKMWLNLERSTAEKLVISGCDYHHMNQHGDYTCWTEHEVIITPSLQFGFNLKITGRDHNRVKEYLHDVFNVALNTEV